MYIRRRHISPIRTVSTPVLKALRRCSGDRKGQHESTVSLVFRRYEQIHGRSVVAEARVLSGGTINFTFDSRTCPENPCLEALFRALSSKSRPRP
jgi:hypothetical protein